MSIVCLAPRQLLESSQRRCNTCLLFEVAPRSPSAMGDRHVALVDAGGYPGSPRGACLRCAVPALPLRSLHPRVRALLPCGMASAPRIDAVPAGRGWSGVPPLAACRRRPTPPLVRPPSVAIPIGPAGPYRPYDPSKTIYVGQLRYGACCGLRRGPARPAMPFVPPALHVRFMPRVPNRQPPAPPASLAPCRHR